MEYKIGQRVKHVGAEFYIESIVGDAAIIGDREITHTVRLDGLSPLYKPGDQVRVKSREEIGRFHINEYLDEVAGKVFTLSIDHGNNRDWDVEELYKWCIHENEFDWYSGVEDKPDDAEQFFDSLQEHEMHGFSTPEEYIKWLKDDTILVAEVHQDKDRNRSALAEVLKIKEPTTNKWMCPKCRFAGSIPDVRQHCVVAHGESLPPPESKSYWETWRAS